MRGRGATLLLGLAAALALSAVWVGLTALTGKTYHLAPVLAAMVPGMIARSTSDMRRNRWTVLAVSLLGILAVATGWILIKAAAIEPTATVIDGQPGGVVGEVVFGALAGATIGTAWLSRRARESTSQGR